MQSTNSKAMGIAVAVTLTFLLTLILTHGTVSAGEIRDSSPPTPTVGPANTTPLRLAADLMENPKFAAAIRKLMKNPQAIAAARKNFGAWLRQEGIQIPTTIAARLVILKKGMRAGRASFPLMASLDGPYDPMANTLAPTTFGKGKQAGEFAALAVIAIGTTALAMLDVAAQEVAIAPIVKAVEGSPIDDSGKTDNNDKRDKKGKNKDKGTTTGDTTGETTGGTTVGTTGNTTG